MKSTNLRITRTILKLFCMALFIVLLIVIPAPKNEVRTPSLPYETYEEEYIAAIDNYIKTGEINVPEGSTFSINENTILIKSNEADAWVKCRFILDNTIPVYESHYERYNDDLILGIFIAICIAPFATYFIVLSIITKLYNKCSYLKKSKRLNQQKKIAEYGDNRKENTNCKKCALINECKCINCSYIGKCGNCPTSDCVESFEEIIFGSNADVNSFVKLSELCTIQEWTDFFENPDYSEDSKVFKVFSDLFVSGKLEPYFKEASEKPENAQEALEILRANPQFFYCKEQIN